MFVFTLTQNKTASDVILRFKIQLQIIIFIGSANPRFIFISTYFITRSDQFHMLCAFKSLTIIKSTKQCKVQKGIQQDSCRPDILTTSHTFPLKAKLSVKALLKQQQSSLYWTCTAALVVVFTTQRTTVKICGIQDRYFLIKYFKCDVIQVKE